MFDWRLVAVVRRDNAPDEFEKTTLQRGDVMIFKVDTGVGHTLLSFYRDADPLYFSWREGDRDDKFLMRRVLSLPSIEAIAFAVVTFAHLRAVRIDEGEVKIATFLLQ